MLALRQLLLSAIFISAAYAQDNGPLETFGSGGKLYSSGTGDHYLLTRQSYVSEDSRGFSGQIRIKKNYPGGGYEFVSMEYIARCFAPFDNWVFVSTYETGKEDDGNNRVDIKSAERFPGAAKKDAYNLYWAACHDQFRKFK
jgi:hypothetical protein